MKKHPLIQIALLSFTMTSSIANADMSSKYEAQHKKDRKEISHPVSVQPFVFSTIEEEVNALHIGAVEEHLGAHVSQTKLEALPAKEAFIEAFNEGDELFEINYNAIDGAGINVGNGKRFSSIPRLDLDGKEAWSNVLPHRITGPNSDSCLSCHNQPVSDGAGGVNDNTVRIDPERLQDGFIERQTPHIFGMGGVQLLAQEMTTELQLQKEKAIFQSCDSRRRVRVELNAKGISFGNIEASCNQVSYRGLTGIDQDLVVKPFEWKGLTAFIRDFVRGASHQELGMQAIELVGDTDSDFDGATNELSVGDVTALAIYAAGQQRPVTKLELNQVTSQLSDEVQEKYGLPLAVNDIQGIENGVQVFNNMQCSACHIPQLTVETPIFSEPSQHPSYRDAVFPAGESVELPSVAINFDITEDIFINSSTLPSGQTLGQFERDNNGAAIVRLYGDLKRHDMGPALAEEFDEGNLGASVFLTENLWGVGSTAPYMHDGRATTLTEAIMYHGGEAKLSKDLFVSSRDSDKQDLITFLENLVIYIE
jgi:hypothetical protein